jgi:hypothetical protein
MEQRVPYPPTPCKSNLAGADGIAAAVPLAFDSIRHSDAGKQEMHLVGGLEEQRQGEVEAERGGGMGTTASYLALRRRWRR